MSSKRVTLRRVDGLHWTVESASGHRVDLDAAPDVGGVDAGMRPTEAVLMALGACSAMDVCAILVKMRQPPGAHEVTVEGVQRQEHPRVFESIDVFHRLEGVLLEANVRRAIFLSITRYCPVHAMLAASVRVTDRYEIWDGGELLASGTVDADDERQRLD